MADQSILEMQRDVLREQRSEAGIHPAEEQHPFLVISKNYITDEDGTAETYKEYYNLDTADPELVTTSLRAVFNEAVNAKDADTPRLESAMIAFLNGIDQKTSLAREWPNAKMHHAFNVYGTLTYNGQPRPQAVKNLAEATEFYQDVYGGGLPPSPRIYQL